MAQYEAQCSKVGSFAYSQYFKLYVILTDVEVSGNYSKVNYNVFCQSSGSGSISATHWKYFNLNGQEIVNVTEKINVSSPNAYIHIASGTTDWIEHNSDGSKSIWFSAQIKGNTYGVAASLEGTFNLVSIPRYANLTSLSVKSRTVNSITLSYTTDRPAWLFARINGGEWLNNGGAFVSNTTSGEFTIYYKDRANTQRLDPNTTYNITVLCRAISHNSGLDTYKDVQATTYDIARISSLPNLEHGSNLIVGITNPANIGSLNLIMKVGNTQILSRIVSNGNNTITFSDTELDNLYKKYGSSSNLTASFTLSGSGYTDTKNCIITLKGNQKTIYVGAKRGKVFVGTKRGVTWQNVNGTWKKGG